VKRPTTVEDEWESAFRAVAELPPMTDEEIGAVACTFAAIDVRAGDHDAAA